MSLVFAISLTMMFYQYFTATDLTFKVGEPVEATIEDTEPVIGHPVSLSAVGRVFSSAEDAVMTPIKGAADDTNDDPIEAVYPPVSLAAVGKVPFYHLSFNLHTLLTFCCARNHQS